MSAWYDERAGEWCTPGEMAERRHEARQRRRLRYARQGRSEPTHVRALLDGLLRRWAHQGRGR